MNAAKVLPLAFVMIAGPQIITSFFFATGDSWKRISATYVLGAALSITLVATAAYLLATATGHNGGGDEESGVGTVDLSIIALLLFAMYYVFRKRGESEPPKWMGKLQAATPGTAFVLGFLLLGFFPSDVVTSFSVGSHLASEGSPWWHALPFVFFTLLLLALPALLVAAVGPRARAFLPKMRDWMDDNSWIVSEVVIAFFIVIILTG